MSDIIGMYEVLDAVEACIKACDHAKRKALAETLSAYSEDFPDEYFCATSAQAPALLYHLLMTIDVASAADGGGPKRNIVVRLVDRKPEGNA
jgi:hypothetical protein